MVQNMTNTSVTWEVNSVAGGNTTVGTISSTGLYTAPNTIPNPNKIQITAASVTNSSVSGSTTFALSSTITVSVSPQTASVIAGLTQQFSVTVQNAVNVGVTWEVNGVPFGDGIKCTYGMSGIGCISGTGLYTAPLSVPNPATVTVTAVSVADPTKSGSATVTITPPVSVSVSPAAATVFAGNTQQFSTTVQGTSNAVTWQISLLGAPIGSISNSGLYTAPTTVSAPTIVVISATSVVDPTKSATATMIVNTPSANDPAFKGRYAFSLLNPGIEAEGPTTLAGGSIVADGAGNITTGVVDNLIPNTSNPSLSSDSVQNVIGAYVVGPGNQGEMALVPTSGEFTQVIVFPFTLGSYSQGTATRASTESGVMLLQDTAAFSTSAIQGDYAFGTSLFGSPNEALAGDFHADGAGNLTSGSLDVNNPQGQGFDLELSDAPFMGTYSVDASSGRGTATLTIPTVGAANVVFYPISAQKLLWLGMTPNAVAFSGSALQQSGSPFVQSSLNGTSVIALSASVGLLTADGNGNVTGSIDGSVDRSGNISTNESFSGTYTVSGNGRGTLNILNQNFVIWLVNQNSAFILEAPHSLAVQAGLIEPQATGPFNNASISGSFASGASSSPLDGTIGFNPDSLFGTFSSDGAGNITGSLIPSTISPLIGGNSFCMVTGGFCQFAATYSVSSNGRGTMDATITSDGNSVSKSFVFYMISPNTFATSTPSFFGP
jgi:hypothetical protein